MDSGAVCPAFATDHLCDRGQADISVPRLSHLENGHNSSCYLIGLLWELNE